MAHSYDQSTGSSSGNDRSRTVSTLVLQLPGLSLLYRVLNDWQSEFKPRQYQR